MLPKCFQQFVFYAKCFDLKKICKLAAKNYLTTFCLDVFYFYIYLSAVLT